MPRLVTAETMRNHRASWWVYTGGDGGRERIRRTAKMRGRWPRGYDVTCSCGWETTTGGATYGTVERELWFHRLIEQGAAREQAAQQVTRPT